MHRSSPRPDSTPPPRPRSLAAALAGALLLAPVQALAAGPTLEEILSFPYASSLVAAAEAEDIAWELFEEGERSLWTAAPPAFEPRELVRYPGDDGQALGSLTLSADGRLLLYVRGGGPNAAGELPNPASDPGGVERAIWAVTTDGAGAPWKVAVGGNPVLAPTGDRVVFAQGGKVMTAPVRPPGEGEEAAGGEAGEEGGEDGEGSEPAEPAAEELFRARGSLGSLAFSPDGTRLAFVSDRDDRSFVGVYSVPAKSITWMAPDFDRDTSPVWSPDGTRVAFLRFGGRRTDELFDWTTGQPFSLWVADAASGAAQPVWRSPGADGGFAQLYPDWSLAWAGDDRLLFVSEHTGWMHVWAVPAAGGEALDLTPGEAEVEGGAISAGGSTLYFWGNHGDRGRRHLWRVPTAGGAAELLTPGEGIESDPVPLPGGRWLAFRAADAGRPQGIEVLALSAAGTPGERRKVAPAALPGGFPAAELVVPRTVTLTASDGLEVEGVLFTPPPAAAGDRRPAVMFLHGGPVRQMLLGWHYSHYYARAYAFNQYLASRGVTVLALNFRSGIGYGRAFRQAAEQGPRGAAEYRDLVAAGLYLRRLPGVDPEAIGLWGGSYGGYLTALGLARDSDLFAAGVDLHGVHDYAYRATNFWVEGGGRGLTEDELEVARRSSPVGDLSTWSSPVLVIHGDDDRNVMFIQSTDLVQRLRERGVHVETLVLPDEVHGFLRHESWLRAFRAAAGFFARHLAGRPPAP